MPESVTPMTEEELAAMNAQPSAAPAPAPAPETAPVASKFTSPDAVQAAYEEAQRKIAEQGAQIAALQQSAAAPAAAAPATGFRFSTGVTDPAVATQELAAKAQAEILAGELTAETAAQVDRMGIRSLVEQAAQGVLAQRQAAEQQIVAKLGGPQAAQEMVDWVNRNLPDAEKAHLNSQLDLGGVAANMALEAIVARRAQSPAAQVFVDGSPPATGAAPYKDQAEWLQAQARGDADVVQRMQASMRAGTI